MPSDPRLLNVQFLALAAYRLQQRLKHHVPDWRYSVGLSSLLEAARALPRREPWDLPALEATSGLAGLLQEARQWQEHRHGA